MGIWTRLINGRYEWAVTKYENYWFWSDGCGGIRWSFKLYLGSFRESESKADWLKKVPGA